MIHDPDQTGGILSDYHFDLPDDRIALRPAKPRSSARLLVATPASITDSRFFDLASHLKEGDRLVFNDTQVIPARLHGFRTRQTSNGVTRSAVEAMLGSHEPDGTWRVLLRPGRKMRIGDQLCFGGRLNAEVVSKDHGGARIRFSETGPEFMSLLHEIGQVPLPPYIAKRRPADDRDVKDYQTVFARTPGAAAAPTASLHFDPGVLDGLRAKGIDMSWITLHVGFGTFLGPKADEVTGDRLHAEWGSISDATACEINRTRSKGGRIIPVGTTSLRLLETAARAASCPSRDVVAWSGQTDIFIKPGFEFRVADALITNFHLPNSTLMMLVCAFMGADRIRQVYEHAIRNDYRFYSYGDGSLLVPRINGQNAT